MASSSVYTAGEQTRGHTLTPMQLRRPSDRIIYQLDLCWRIVGHTEGGLYRHQCKERPQLRAYCEQEDLSYRPLRLRYQAHSLWLRNVRRLNSILLVSHADCHFASRWPAVWLADPSDWPGNGEIDVVETVNQGNTGNQMALHTSKGCKMNGKRAQAGTVQGTNCYNGELNL